MSDQHKPSRKAGKSNPAVPVFMLQPGSPVAGKILGRTLPDGASLLLRMHRLSDLCMRELRDLAGDTPAKSD